MKIAVNRCFGGFVLSEKAYNYLGLEWDGHGCGYNSDESRTDAKLIACIEALGKEASGPFANVVVIEIPDDVQYTIDDYDGRETVREVHRSW